MDTAPTGAKVRILNIGPKFYQGMGLKPGRYHVETSKRGYQTKKMWVRLDAGEDKKVAVNLEQLQASLHPTKKIAPPSPNKRLYDLPLELYKEEKYEEAIAGFKSFVKTFPKSELVDNAQYWVGESYMGLKQYHRAILAFQVVIKEYSKGNKVPNALLRQGVAFYAIKDKVSAILLMKKTIRRYPKSSEAKIAKAKLRIWR